MQTVAGQGSQQQSVNATGNLTLLSQSHCVYPESSPRLPSQGNLCPPLSSHPLAVLSKWQVFPAQRNREHTAGNEPMEKPASPSGPWLIQFSVPWGHKGVREQRGAASSSRKNKMKGKHSCKAQPWQQRDGFGDCREPGEHMRFRQWMERDRLLSLLLRHYQVLTKHRPEEYTFFLWATPEKVPSNLLWTRVLFCKWR